MVSALVCVSMVLVALSGALAWGPDTETVDVYNPLRTLDLLGGIAPVAVAGASVLASLANLGFVANHPYPYLYGNPWYGYGAPYAPGYGYGYGAPGYGFPYPYIRGVASDF